MDERRIRQIDLGAGRESDDMVKALIWILKLDCNMQPGHTKTAGSLAQFGGIVNHAGRDIFPRGLIEVSFD